jgi:hypothetical protein
MPTLQPVGREYIDTKRYEPIRIPIIGHAITDGAEVMETFAFHGKRGFGKALVYDRRVREQGKVTYALVLDYLESAAADGEFDRLKAFIDRADIEVDAQTIVDAQQALVAEYQKDRPTVARSSGGRSKQKQTSAAGSGGKGSTSTRSRST